LWAVDSCRNGNFDAVLMDIHMPELNGIEATELIRMFDSEIPVIALTAYNDEMNRTRCAKAGMNGLIEKPVSLHMLKDVISNFVAREN
jgi:CheY-like chemotaxis protein